VTDTTRVKDEHMHLQLKCLVHLCVFRSQKKASRAPVTTKENKDKLHKVNILMAISTAIIALPIPLSSVFSDAFRGDDGRTVLAASQHDSTSIPAKKVTKTRVKGSSVMLG